MKILVILILSGISTFGYYNFQKKERNILEQNKKTFEQRLEGVLLLTETKYKTSNQNFGINFISKQTVIFQIISRKLLENMAGNEFGFGIHLSFDQSFPSTKEELARFKSSDFAARFSFHTWDGIPTYQIDLKNDKEGTIDLAKKIIEIVYQNPLNEIEIDEFEI